MATPSPTRAVDQFAFEFDDEASRIGLEVLFALVGTRDWCHRRVDSLNLLEGDRGRRRVSVDCTPTKILWTDKSLPDPTGQLLVPLAYMAKRSIRDLDVHDASGASLPVLGTEANGRVAASTIGAILELFGRNPIRGKTAKATKLWRLVQTVAFAEGREARDAAEQIARLPLHKRLRELILDLADNFLLFAVLPESQVGVRQVLKFSYHWSYAAPSPEPLLPRLRGFILAGFGLEDYTLRVELGSPSSSRSFHFECPAPPGLSVAEVKLPPDETGSSPTDEVLTSVGHAHGRYSDANTGRGLPAIVRLRLEPNGLLGRVYLGAIGALAFFTMAIIFGWYEILVRAQDASVAVLLAILAVLLGLNARAKENRVLARLLSPLRVSSLLLSIIVFGYAGVLVLKLGLVLAASYSALGVVVSLAIAVFAGSGYWELLSAHRVRVGP